MHNVKNNSNPDELMSILWIYSLLLTIKWLDIYNYILRNNQSKHRVQHMYNPYAYTNLSLKFREPVKFYTEESYFKNAWNFRRFSKLQFGDYC